jgi:hypothetical protein
MRSIGAGLSFDHCVAQKKKCAEERKKLILRTLLAFSSVLLA